MTAIVIASDRYGLIRIQPVNNILTSLQHSDANLRRASFVIDIVSILSPGRLEYRAGFQAVSNSLQPAIRSFSASRKHGAS
jgi:hypothetical protein